MRAYEEALRPATAAWRQVLLTHDDVQDRRRYLNARHALDALLERAAWCRSSTRTTPSPSTRSSSATTTRSRRWSAALVEADALVILTDVDGLYDADPRKQPRARSCIQHRRAGHAARCSRSAGGSGERGRHRRHGHQGARRGAGDRARHALRDRRRAQRPARLARGARRRRRWARCSSRQQSRRNARTAWIAHALKPRGTLVVDAGAQARGRWSGRRACSRPGIAAGRGELRRRATRWTSCDRAGEVSRAGSRRTARTSCGRSRGRRATQIEAALGYRGLDEAVHRDDLAILEVA